MKYTNSFLLLVLFGGTWRLGHPTCVLESEFGFVLNCAFKKSGLFRVRNLGGIKAHVGLGFSLGDELGFKESLSNVDTETNRRRSVQGSSKLQAVLAQQANIGKSIPIRPSPMSPTVQSMPEVIIQQKKSQMLTIPPFKPIPPAPERPSTISSFNKTRRTDTNSIPTPALMGVVPAFNALPPSISRLSSGPTVAVDTKKPAVAVIVPIANKSQAADKLSSSNLALRTLPSSTNEIAPFLPQTTTNSIQALSAATNVSREAIEAALLMRQQQLLQKKVAASTTTTTTTYKPPPTLIKHSGNRNKVMNAPKEYYPVGYDKNFDDNFASRVDLPETSFYCGDQKHFPGLYADEDLGCMVFHVCALTDDGLVMKSFLCPESTLFDQTILKCNWWFYVECRNSKKLYDSNIPVSKSYQLMKALTFFSSYKNDAQTSKPKAKD